MLGLGLAADTLNDWLIEIDGLAAEIDTEGEAAEMLGLGLAPDKLGEALRLILGLAALVLGDKLTLVLGDAADTLALVVTNGCDVLRDGLQLALADSETLGEADNWLGEVLTLIDGESPAFPPPNH